MNVSDIKKLLLVGTAIVAVGTVGLSTEARADVETLAADATWASTGLPADGTQDGTTAGAGDAVDLTNFTLTFTDNNVANDGGGVGVFTVGNISDSGTGNLSILSNAADADDTFSVTATSISIAGDATVANTDAHDNTVAVDVTGFTVVGGDLGLTNTDSDTAATVAMSTVGNLTVTGVTTLTAGVQTGASSALTVGGDAAFTGGAILADTSVGDARIVLNGAAAQTVTGTINGLADSDGRISISNTDAADGVTFNDEIGTTNTIFGITTNSNGNDTRTTFTDNVSVAGTIGFGDNNGSDTNIVEFDASGNTIAVNGSVNGGGAADTNNVSVLGGNAVTFNNNIGANVDTVSLDGTGDTNFNGDINADLVFTMNSTAILADNSDITGSVNSVAGPLGTLELLGSTIITGDVGADAATGLNLIDVQAAGETLTLNGDEAFAEDITVISGANLVAQGDITVADTLTIDGATFTGAAGTQVVADTITGDATYNVTIENLDAISAINTDETVTLVSTNGIDLSDSTINVNVVGHVATQGIIFANGQAGTANFDQANVTATSASLVQDIATTFDAGGNNVFISVSTDIAGVAVDGNNGNVADVLDELNDTSDEQILAVLDAVVGATTAGEVNEILEGLTPVADNGTISATINATEQGLNVTSDRLLFLRQYAEENGVASGNVASGLEAWIQAYGTTGDQDERDNIAGYGIDTVGVAFGLDTRNIHEDLIVGLAGSYATTEVESENANRATTDIDSYQVTAYGEYDIDSRSYVNGQVGYVFSDNESQRSDVGGVAGLNANGEFDSHQVIARLETGRSYPMQYGATLTPRAKVNYVHYTADEYTETGAGGANLNVDTESLNLLELGVGADLSWSLAYKNGALVTPNLHVGVRHDVIGDEIQSTNTFAAGGSSFQSQGADPAQTTFELGAGVSMMTSNNIEIVADYDYEVKSDYDSHSALLKATYKF